MKSLVRLIMIAGLATWSVGGVAVAQEPKKPRRPEPIQIDPELTKKFEEQGRRPYIAVPEPLVDLEAVNAAGSNHVTARLLSMSDQSVLVAVKLTPEQKAELSERWPTVTTQEEADHQTILGDELCLRYPVSVEFDLHRLEPKLGQMLDLELGITSENRPIVLFVRGT